MSRVKHGNKHLNLPKGDERCNPGPVIIIQSAKGDYKQARTLSEWRKLKYGMSTQSFHRKSSSRKAALREEYLKDTCRDKEEVADKGLTYEQANRSKEDI